MTDQLPLPGPEKIECPDGCGKFGRPTNNGHVQGCRGPEGQPCWKCIGRRSKRGGTTKQRAARKALGIAGPSLGADHEENWRGALRHEVKSGKRETQGTDTYYRVCRQQSDASRAIGDNRPFAAILMPPGMSDGYAVVKLSELRDVAWAVVEHESSQ